MGFQREEGPFLAEEGAFLIEMMHYARVSYESGCDREIVEGVFF